MSNENTTQSISESEDTQTALVEETKTYHRRTERGKFRISNIPVLPQLAAALSLLLIVFGITYIGVAGTIAPAPTQSSYIETTVEARENETLQTSNPFEGTALEAKSAIVWDVRNREVLFSKNADEPLPLASITKLMTVLVASELLGPNEIVPVSLEALRTEGDSGLIDGEKFIVQDLTDLILITSSNDGAAALSASAGAIVEKNYDPEEVFVHAMNLRAQELGLTHTQFFNSTGLDLSESEAGAYGTARDMAHLMAYIITEAQDAVALTKADLVKIWNTDGLYHIAQNTNEIVNDIDGLIASKTGYTELAGGNLVVAFNVGLNRPIIVAVLGSTYSGRFEDATNLIERTRRFVTQE